MSTTQQLPVTVYAEMTPNPNVMKFVADRMLLPTGDIAEYLSLAEAKGSSSLAEKLFSFPFITGVFITRNFVALTRNESVQWELIHLEIREFITDFLKENATVVETIPETKVRETEKEGEKIEIDIEPEINTDLDRKIVALLEEYVTPAVENDGGAIHFKSFNEESGKVTVVLKGACSGCPSSTATLRGGVETLLKGHVTEVTEVVALEG